MPVLLIVSFVNDAVPDWKATDVVPFKLCVVEPVTKATVAVHELMFAVCPYVIKLLHNSISKKL